MLRKRKSKRLFQCYSLKLSCTWLLQHFLHSFIIFVFKRFLSVWSLVICSIVDFIQFQIEMTVLKHVICWLRICVYSSWTLSISICLYFVRWQGYFFLKCLFQMDWCLCGNKLLAKRAKKNCGEKCFCENVLEGLNEIYANATHPIPRKFYHLQCYIYKKLLENLQTDTF